MRQFRSPTFNQAVAIARMFKDSNRVRMLHGEIEPNTESFVMPNGFVDWLEYDAACAMYRNRHIGV